MIVISIIVPTYKPEFYLKECLISLYNQRMNKKKYEVILVLNGPKEPYYKEIEKFKLEKKFQNLKIIFSEEKGVSNARNLGIEKSKGQYILFLDDDDLLSDNYLEKIYSKASNKVCIISNLKSFRVNKSEKLNDYQSNYFKKNILINTTNPLKVRKALSISCGRLISKEIIKNVKFNDNIKRGEDSLFMAEISRNIEGYKFTEESCIYYRRIRKESASRKKVKILISKKELIKLFFLYSKLLLKKEYNKLFILSRIFAQVIKILK